VFYLLLFRSGEKNQIVDASHGVVCKLDRDREGGFKKNMVDFSLLHGCPLMLTDDLKRLSQRLGIVHALRNPPRTDKQWMICILKFRFDGITTDKINEILGIRGKLQEKESAMNAGTLLNENVDILQGAMEEDEQDEVMAVIENHREALAKTANLFRPSRAGLVSFRPNDISTEEVEHLAPPGYRVYKDTTLHHRWKLESKAPKAMHTKAYGGLDGFDEKQALRHCLRLAWKSLEATEAGYPCPHDIDSI
jgi:hypothetical protein